MALFKIFNNIDSQNENLPSIYTKGYMYYDAKKSLFYIDTAGTGTSTGTRQAINAWGAEIALKDSLNQQIDSTYIKNISASGCTITFTRGDGTTGTFQTQDTITEDKKVNVTLKGSSKAYLLADTTAPTATAAAHEAVADTAVYLDTTSGSLAATSFTGNGSALTNLNASNISSGTLNAARLATSGATAGSYGPTDNVTPTFGATFSVPKITIDDKGRITEASTKTVTIPNPPITQVAGKTGNVSLGTLHIGPKTYNGADNVTITIADLGMTSAMTFLGITTTSLTDGGTTSPIILQDGSSIIPTNGDVVLVKATSEEFVFSQGVWTQLGMATSFAMENHYHGNITNEGQLATASSIVITNASKNITTGASLSPTIITQTTATKFLREDGAWSAPSYPVLHTLTFGANNAFSFDGSQDVNVPVYTGTGVWA